MAENVFLIRWQRSLQYMRDTHNLITIQQNVLHLSNKYTIRVVSHSYLFTHLNVGWFKARLKKNVSASVLMATA